MDNLRLIRHHRREARTYGGIVTKLLYPTKNAIGGTLLSASMSYTSAWIALIGGIIGRIAGRIPNALFTVEFHSRAPLR